MTKISFDLVSPEKLIFSDKVGMIIVPGKEGDIVVAEGEWISATGFLTGTHSGKYLGVEPTGKSIKMQFSDFWTIKDGKFLDNYVMVDNHGVFEQMGLKFK